MRGGECAFALHQQGSHIHVLPLYAPFRHFSPRIVFRCRCSLLTFSCSFLLSFLLFTICRGNPRRLRLTVGTSLAACATHVHFISSRPDAEGARLTSGGLRGEGKEKPVEGCGTVALRFLAVSLPISLSCFL